MGGASSTFTNKLMFVSIKKDAKKPIKNDRPGQNANSLYMQVKLSRLDQMQLVQK